MLLPQKGLNIKIQTTIKEPNETEIESPYHVPFQGIVRYSSLGKVFLMGDFNAKMQNRQCDTYDLGRARNDAFNIFGEIRNM